MKKIFIALSVMAALAFSLAPVQANVPGARDIAPGSQFKAYFLVSKDRVDTGAGPSTLLQVSEVKGMVDASLPQALRWSDLHFQFYTRDSDFVFNLNKPLTKWQTKLWDIGQMLDDDVGPTKREEFAVTFEGEDYYAGYVIVTEERFWSADNIVADVIQLDLSSGLAAIGNILMKAWVGDRDGQDMPCWSIDHVLAGVNPAAVPWWTVEWEFRAHEVFSGSAMASAQERIWTGDCWVNQDDWENGWFGMYPRYLINDDNSAKTYWLFLRNSIENLNTGGLIPVIDFHSWAINQAEDVRSVSIPIREFTVLDAEEDVVPSSLLVSLPYVGQVNMQIPGEYNEGENKSQPPRVFMDMELVGWNWKMANDPVNPNLNWAGMSLIAAEAGTLGGGPM